MDFISSLLGRLWNVSSSQEDRYRKAEYYTHVPNLCKVAQDLFEKGYNDQGFYVSTMLKCIEKNSKEKHNVSYTKWLVGVDSKVRPMGSSYSYWDMHSRIDYKHSHLWKHAIAVDILVDNKPKVTGDVSFGITDCAKVRAGFGSPSYLEPMKLELLCFREHIAMRLRCVDFEVKECNFRFLKHYVAPRRLDVSTAAYASCLKLGAEGSYVPETGRFVSCCVGGAINTDYFSASVIYWRDSLSGSIVTHFNGFNLGAEISKLISSDRYIVTLGVADMREAGEMYKVKVNNLGVMSGSIEKDLFHDAVVSVSAEVELKCLSKCPKVGFKVLLKSSSLQTFDVGEGS